MTKHHFEIIQNIENPHECVHPNDLLPQNKTIFKKVNLKFEILNFFFNSENYQI